MAKLKQITPMLLVADLKASLAFFETVLGFETRLRMTEFDYAYLARASKWRAVDGGHKP